MSLSLLSQPTEFVLIETGLPVCELCANCRKNIQKQRVCSKSNKITAVLYGWYNFVFLNSRIRFVMNRLIEVCHVPLILEWLY